MTTPKNKLKNTQRVGVVGYLHGTSTARGRVTAGTKARRLAVVREFARYHRINDQATEVTTTTVRVHWLTIAPSHIIFL